MDPDSRARSQLANERTFLAWIRTGLSMLVLGLAAAQFISQEEVDQIPIVTVFSLFLAGSGLLLTLMAGAQFTRARKQINSGSYDSGTTAIGLTLAVTIIANLIGIAIILFLRQPL